MNEIIDYLSQFVRDPKVYDSLPSGDPLIEVIPTWWREVMQLRGDDRVKRTLIQWEGVRHLFPWLWECLRESLLNVVLFSDGKSWQLLYQIDNDGTMAYFAGDNPRGKTLAGPVQSVWDQFPPNVRRFYGTIHDGWCEVGSRSLGLLPTRSFFVLGQREWEIVKEDGILGCDLDNLVAVFGNGEGDYVALSIESSPYGDVLFFPDDRPRLRIDAWVMIDRWLAISLGHLED